MIKKIDEFKARITNYLPMEKLKQNPVYVIASFLVLLLLPVTVFYTVAYQTDLTEVVVNKFIEKEVAIEISEIFAENVKEDVAITNTGDLDVYIRFKITVSAIDGDGNTVALPISMMNTSTTVADITYRAITLDDFNILENEWEKEFLEIDGIYYYTGVVEPGDSFDIFDKATFNVPVFDPTILDLPLPLIDGDKNPYYVLDTDGNLVYKTDGTAYTEAEITAGGYTSLINEEGTYTYMLSSYTPVLTIVADSIQVEGAEEAWGVSVVNGIITGTGEVD